MQQRVRPELGRGRGRDNRQGRSHEDEQQLAAQARMVTSPASCRSRCAACPLNPSSTGSLLQSAITSARLAAECPCRHCT
eukprot:1915681-Rhodomonas_salina.1